MSGFCSKFAQRNERLVLTLISKKWLVFWIATALLVTGYIGEQTWAAYAAFAVGAEVLQRVKGVTPGGQESA